MLLRFLNKLEYGAKQAVENCVRVQPQEKVVIITDRNTKFIADKIYKYCKKITPKNIYLFIMEDFGERPEDGRHPLKFPEKIGKELANADASFYCAAGKKGELQSFRIPMLKHTETNKKIRHAHMPGISKLLMETGMNCDYQKVQKLSAKILEIVKNVKTITVTTSAGTDFTAHFEPDKIRWVNCDGLIRPENWSNLPDGEIFTCVKEIPEGILVVDGVLGDFFCQKYGTLENIPMIVKIKNTKVVDIQCQNKELLDEFKQHINSAPNGDRIGEFAIGTNIGLKKLIGNLLQDEKFPGIHVAFGHGYPEKTGSDWSSNIHVDAVLQNCTIIVDDKILMENGKFQPDLIGET